MGLTPYSPLAGGFLSGKYSRAGEAVDTRRGAITGGPSEGQFAVIDVLTSIAAERGPTRPRSRWRGC
jgi:aryl-alcohol dehydrogenase (NADP+)